MHGMLRTVSLRGESENDEMVSLIEYLGIPKTIGLVLVSALLISQVIGIILDVKGKYVPEFFNLRKYFARRKQERQALRDLPDALSKMEVLYNDMLVHYNADNIRMRDEWIRGVNEGMKLHDENMQEISRKLDQNNHDTLEIRIENMRSEIINFATLVSDDKTPVTRERFDRMFRLYEDYERILEQNNMTNGQVDISYQLIKESYEKHTKDRSFLEDARGMYK